MKWINFGRMAYWIVLEYYRGDNGYSVKRGRLNPANPFLGDFAVKTCVDGPIYDPKEAVERLNYWRAACCRSGIKDKT